MNDQAKQSDNPAAPRQSKPPEQKTLSADQRAITEKSPQANSLSALKRTVITLMIIVAAGVFIISMLPKGLFSDDLSHIGTGTPAAVLVYEPAHPTSMAVMDLMREARRDKPGVTFLVATSGTPDGQAFIRHFNTPPTGTLLFFDAQGEPVTALAAPDSVDEILAAMDELVSQY